MEKKTAISIGEVVNTLLQPLKVKIHPLLANPDTKLPFVVYSRKGVEVEQDKDGPYSEHVTVDINIVAGSYDESVKLAEKARGLLLTEGTISGLELCSSELVGLDENRTDDIYIQTLTIKYEVLCQ